MTKEFAKKAAIPYLFILGVSLFLSLRAFAFDAHQPFDIAADLIDYVDANQTITATGHVVVVQSSSTLTADSVIYDRSDNHMEARGNVVLHDKGQILVGDYMDYDLVKEEGTVTNAMGMASAWRFKSAVWDKKEDYFSGHDVLFTNCDLIDPHYHLRSTRIHLIPDRLFWAWNSIVYVDDKPVFYTPFMYKYLDHRPVVTQLQPGNDTVNGAFVKTQTTWYINKNVYDRVLFDHYSVAGNGIGNELDYQSTGTVKGSLFAYYIDPKANPNLSGAPTIPQYTIRSYHWEKINASTTLQSNVNVRQNISFNDQYFSEDNNGAISDLNNSIALTQQKKNYNQRLVVETLDAPEPGDTSTFALTHVQTASLPRYDFTLYQTPLFSQTVSTQPALPTPLGHWGPIMYSADSSLGEEYSRLNEQTQTKGVGDVTLTDGIALSRRWSFTPTLTPQLNWQDKPDPENQYIYGQAPPGSIVPPFNVNGSTVTTSTTTFTPSYLYRGFQGHVGTSDTLRYRATESLTLDQNYMLNLRMAPNGVGLDRAQDDGGVETHHLTWLAYWRPNFQILFRSYSGYDLRTIANENPDAYDQRRVDPWTNEMTLIPRGSAFDYFFRYQAAWWPTRVNLWQSFVDYHGPYHTIFQVGLLYNSGQQGVLTMNNSVGVFFSPGWRVDAVVHSFVPDGSSSTQPSSIVDSSIILTRDLHCWTMQFIYREILPYTQSYSVLFNLKLGPSDVAQQTSNQNFESQFYPWRANAYAR